MQLPIICRPSSSLVLASREGTTMAKRKRRTYKKHRDSPALTRADIARLSIVRGAKITKACLELTIDILKSLGTFFDNVVKAFEHKGETS